MTASSVKGAADIDWSDKQQRQRVLRGIVADADRLLTTVREVRGQLEAGSVADGRLERAASLLSRVLAQDIERPPEGATLRDGVAKDRMPAIHDPEMRHGRKSKAKRFDGFKAHIAVDTDSQVITAVAQLPGNAPDWSKHSCWSSRRKRIPSVRSKKPLATVLTVQG